MRVLMSLLLFGSFERMDGVIQQNLMTSLMARMRRDRREKVDVVKRQIRYERVHVDCDLISYVPDDAERVGVYVGAQPLSPDHNYFEIELIDTGMAATISIGLVPIRFPLDKRPGCFAHSVGYHADDGRLYKGHQRGSAFGPKCETGDRMGCGVKFDQVVSHEYDRPLLPIFFTRNGKEMGSTLIQWPQSGLFPAVGMNSAGEEVRLTLDINWMDEEDTLMSIDSHEDEWSRLHDINVNGQILEYIGRGKSIVDVGLAQARWPLTTTSHYFEIEIVDPGENCYIAIGVARRDYPKHRHPGWNKGSVAYHADDGKIFIGSGVGNPFGPPCHKGDVMGCGLIFPRDYVGPFDSDDFRDISPSSSNGVDDAIESDEQEGSHSESEDDDWWNESDENSVKVQVFFTRNGKTIGRKELTVPKGGFFPTVGMLSNEEKVKVDLRPLSG
uniref:B30.2/SPRY domain-containing protein n=1 Tax=Strigamia maritima TaxID=126957 RepID=T1IP15_STRMM